MTLEPFARYTEDHTGVGFFIRIANQTRGCVGAGKYFKFEYACNGAAVAVCIGPFSFSWISAFGHDLPKWMHSNSSTSASIPNR